MEKTGPDKPEESFKSFLKEKFRREREDINIVSNMLTKKGKTEPVSEKDANMKDIYESSEPLKQ